MMFSLTRGALRGCLGTLAGLAFAAAAHAGGYHTPQPGPGKLVTTVERMQASVTYANPGSTPPLATYVGYRVTITNTGGSAVDEVRFSGAATVTAPGESASVSSVDGATCTIAANTVDCALGSLAAGQSAPSFVVLFNAPARAAGSTVPPGVDGSCATTDCVSFAGKTRYSLAQKKWSWTPDCDIALDWGPITVALAAPDPSSVSSAVPKTGGTVFTGTTGAVSKTDPFSTTVVIPPGTTSTTASIAEASTTTLCGVLSTCYTSQVTVPGTFSPYLQVVLRLDASAAPKKTQIGSILISYDGVIIGDCASPTSPRSDGIPCIAARKTIAAPDSDTDGKGHKLDRKGKGRGHDHHGDDCDDEAQSFEWTLINTKNGSLKIF